MAQFQHDLETDHRTRSRTRFVQPLLLPGTKILVAEPGTRFLVLEFGTRNVVPENRAESSTRVLPETSYQKRDTDSGTRLLIPGTGNMVLEIWYWYQNLVRYYNPVPET